MGIHRQTDTETVSISRDGNETTGVAATPFDVDSMADEQFAGLLDTQQRFFRIAKTAYQILGVEVAPDSGDLITLADGTVFEVNPISPGQTPWSWHDVNRTTYLVFASFVRET